MQILSVLLSFSHLCSHCSGLPPSQPPIGCGLPPSQPVLWAPSISACALGSLHLSLCSGIPPSQPPIGSGLPPSQPVLWAPPSISASHWLWAPSISACALGSLHLSLCSGLPPSQPPIGSRLPPSQLVL